jgi:carboxymethylenebutenolidase
MKQLTACCVAVLAVCLLASPVFAQGPVMSKEITLKAGGEEFKAFVAMPDGPGPYPGLVVIQEWWGLNDWIKECANRLAAKGFIAIAPDLYHGKVTDDPKVASQLIKGLPKDRAMADLKATIDALVAMKNVKKDNIGSIGWCMGGMYSLQAALNDDRIKSCVMCYGSVVTDADKLKTLNAKVLGVFGEDDKGIKAADVRTFEGALKSAGKSVEKINIYQGAGHGFMRPKNGANPNPEYREKQANDAWTQIEAFFTKSLAK